MQSELHTHTLTHAHIANVQYTMTMGGNQPQAGAWYGGEECTLATACSEILRNPEQLSPNIARNPRKVRYRD